MKKTPPKHAYLWSLHDDELVERDEYSVAKKIDSSEFDLIVYSDIYHRGTSQNGIYLQDANTIENQLFWAKVSRAYPKSKIAFIDGIGVHDSSHKPIMKVSLICRII